MNKPELTPFEIISRNVKVKLALRVKGTVITNVVDNQITISISNNGLVYNKTVIIKDLEDTDSTSVSDNIYKLYRKFIMKNFFTFD